MDSLSCFSLQILNLRFRSQQSCSFQEILTLPMLSTSTNDECQSKTKIESDNFFLPLYLVYSVPRLCTLVDKI